MRREKRNVKLQTHIPQSLHEQLDLFAQQDNAISMSQWLHDQLDELATLRIAKQKIGRRVGNQ